MRNIGEGRGSEWDFSLALENIQKHQRVSPEIVPSRGSEPDQYDRRESLRERASPVRVHPAHKRSSELIGFAGSPYPCKGSWIVFHQVIRHAYKVRNL